MLGRTSLALCRKSLYYSGIGPCGQYPAQEKGERYAAVLVDQLRGFVQHIAKNIERADLAKLSSDQREEVYGLRDRIIDALNQI